MLAHRAQLRAGVEQRRRRCARCRSTNAPALPCRRAISSARRARSCRPGCPRRRSAARRRADDLGEHGARDQHALGRLMASVTSAAALRRRSRLRRRALIGVRMEADQRQHHEEADDVGHRHGPAVAQPLARPTRACGYMLRQRHAGRRAEPDHRAAEADRVGQEAPVVAALLERQRGERNVVEHRRQEAQAERRLPRRRRQLLDRHHRRAQHQRQQEDRALERRRAAGSSPAGATPRGQQDRQPTPQRRGTGSGRDTSLKRVLTITLTTIAADQDERPRCPRASSRCARSASSSFWIGE